LNPVRDQPSRALAAVGTHLGGVPHFGIRGEVVELDRSGRGPRLTLADQDAVLSLFIPRCIADVGDMPQVRDVVEAEAETRLQKDGAKCYLCATSAVRISQQVGPLAEQQALAIQTLEPSIFFGRTPGATSSSPKLVWGRCQR